MAGGGRCGRSRPLWPEAAAKAASRAQPRRCERPVEAWLWVWGEVPLELRKAAGEGLLSTLLRS